LIEFFEDGELELFHLKADPFEKKNPAAEDPKKSATLSKDQSPMRNELCQ
jgi:hypothetical protein